MFAFEPGSFWWENVIAVVILLEFLARMLERWKQVIKIMFEVLSFYNWERESLIFFNKDNSAIW